MSFNRFYLCDFKELPRLAMIGVLSSLLSACTPSIQPIQAVESNETVEEEDVNSRNDDKKRPRNPPQPKKSKEPKPPGSGNTSDKDKPKPPGKRPHPDDVDALDLLMREGLLLDTPGIGQKRPRLTPAHEDPKKGPLDQKTLEYVNYLKALKLGDSKTVSRFLEESRFGVNDVVDGFGNSSIHIAAQGGHPSVITLLAESKADLNQANHQLWTPLQIAAHHGHRGAVTALILAGADVADTFEHVRRRNDSQTARALIAAGVDIHARGKNGRPSLYQSTLDSFRANRDPETLARFNFLLLAIAAECSICLEPNLTEGKNSHAPLSATPCGHVFHSNCIDTWMNESRTCPACRQDIPDGELETTMIVPVPIKRFRAREFML